MVRDRFVLDPMAQRRCARNDVQTEPSMCRRRAARVMIIWDCFQQKTATNFDGSPRTAASVCRLLVSPLLAALTCQAISPEHKQEPTDTHRHDLENKDILRSEGAGKIGAVR